jgi:superfamily II DNA or RNA helicase
MVKAFLDTSSVEDYRRFLAIKNLPRYRFQGRLANVPDEYASRVGLKPPKSRATSDYKPSDFLFDYQRDIAHIAIQKRKYAVFAECGLGKTLILLEFARYAAQQIKRNQCILIVSPLMVIPQTCRESQRFFNWEPEHVSARDLQHWLVNGKSKVGITNYESIRPELKSGRLAGLILDEASLLKSHYGKWGTKLIEMGRGLSWKLSLTGTPAPNDRIEYANQAVFLDRFRSVNQFLATYFVNRGETQNRWELKPHALKPFYRALSDWCIFLSDPSVYGWKDNCTTIPPIHVHIHDVDLTPEQQAIARELTGDLFTNHVGGITGRSKLAQLGKGRFEGRDVPTNKPAFIRALCESWPTEGTLVWCLFNEEQDAIHAAIPGSESISGDTPHEKRIAIIDRFKSGETRVLVTKPKILGYGLNLQVATRQIFSGLADSYESFHQAVKRSNRIGSSKPLNVHIPVTDVERPMIETVLAKAHRVEEDTREQERIFERCRA